MAWGWVNNQENCILGETECGFHANAHLWTGTAYLADIAIVQLWLFGRPFGLLDLALVENRFLVCVDGMAGDRATSSVAPRGVGVLFWRLLRLQWWRWRLLRLLERRLRLRLRGRQLRRLEVRRRGCVTARHIAGIAETGWSNKERDTVRQYAGGYLWHINLNRTRPYQSRT